MTEQPAAILLRCPDCSVELGGLDADRVWTCATCSRAWEVQDGALAARAFRVWAAPCTGLKPGTTNEGADTALEVTPFRSVDGGVPGNRTNSDGRVVHLPFWRIGYRAVIESADDAARRAVEGAAASGRAWVRAFSLRGAFLMGDPGQALTDASHAEHVEDAPLPRCVGARLSSAEAVRLAELFVLARADRVSDVTPVTLRLDVRDVALVAVPYVDAGEEFVCAVDGRGFRKAAMPDAGTV